MAGPWEKYAQPEQPSGPWAKYGQSGQGSERKAIAITPDGGTIWELPGGGRAFSSPNYSTSDPAQIERLLEGATPADVSMSGWNQQIIGQNPASARAMKAIEGVPFIGSYADEAAGAIYGPQARDAWRATSKAMDTEHPWQSAGLQIGGGVAATVPALAASLPTLAANSLGGNMALGALAGMAEGAVSGFGRGEGSAQDRVRPAVGGGLFGAGIGMAVPAVAHGAGALAGLFRNKLMEARGVGRAADDLGISRRAGRLLSDTLGMDDPAAMQRALGLAGPDAMLADAGPSVQGALDAVIQSPGEGARLALGRIDDRATAAGGRLTGALDQTMGVPQGMNAAQTAIRRGTSAARGAAYDAAYASPIDYASDAGMALEGLLGRVPGKAIQDANRLMQLDGDMSRQIMAQIADDGTMTFTRMPDVRQWDYIKRALDQAAASGEGQGALGGQTPLGRAYQGLARTIRDTLGDAVPEYRTALDTAADAIGQVQGVKFGANLLSPKTTREEAMDFLRGATAAERAAVKQGVRQQIDDAVANVRSVASDPNIDARQAYKAMTDLSSPSARAKMEMLLGSDWPTVQAALDDAARAIGLRARVATNSRTFGRQQFGQMLDDAMEPGRIASGEGLGPIATPKGLWQQLWGTTPQAVQKAKASTKAELADVLTRPNAQATLDALDRARAAFPILPDAGAGVLGASLAVGAGATPALAELLRRRILQQ